MNDAVLMHRLHFGFTVTFHYLFPQLTMRLAPLIVLLKTIYLRTDNLPYDRAARFLGQDFWYQLRYGRRHWNSDGVSVRDELVALLQTNGRCHRTTAPDGLSGRPSGIPPSLSINFCRAVV